MAMDHIRVDGAVTFWNVGEYTDLDLYEIGLARCGMRKFVPNPRTQASALKDALGDTFQPNGNANITFRIERMENSDAFQVDRIERGDVNIGNITQREMIAYIENGVMHFDPHDHRASAIVQHYNRHLGLVRGSTITRSLVDIVSHLGGVSLRDTGGVYWLPETALSVWEDVATAAENASIGKRCMVHTMKHHFDASALRSVRVAFEKEILTRAKQISDEMQVAEIGDRAIENRRTECHAMRQKIKQYEEILGETLTVLRDAVSHAESAEALGALINA